MHNVKMNYLNKTPKQLINEIRDSAGMTDTGIADASGISQSTISRLRSGALKDTSSKNWLTLISMHVSKVQRIRDAHKEK